MKFYDLAGMAELLQTDESAILAMAMEGSIPEPHFIGKRIVRWSEHDIGAWAEGGCKPSRPTLGRDDWVKLRQANRCEFLEKHLAEKELKSAVACSCAADKSTDANAVAACQCK